MVPDGSRGVIAGYKSLRYSNHASVTNSSVTPSTSDPPSTKPQKNRITKISFLRQSRWQVLSVSVVRWSSWEELDHKGLVFCARTDPESVIETRPLTSHPSQLNIRYDFRSLDTHTMMLMFIFTFNQQLNNCRSQARVCYHCLLRISDDDDDILIRPLIL